MRPLVPDDIDDIARLYGDPEVTRYITGGVHSREMAQAELRHGRNEQLRRIAQEIIVDQTQEIAAMQLATGQESRK